jgi:hypothetical protein
MPVFMESAASGWFEVLETQFHLKNIKSEGTKFFSVMAALPLHLVMKLPSQLRQAKKFTE